MESRPGCQQAYRNCIHSSDNSFSSMCQPQAQDPMNAYNLFCPQVPCDKYQVSLAPLNGTSLDNVDEEVCLSE